MQQWRHDLHALVEAADPVIERIAERVELRLMPAAAQAEDQPATADLVELRGHLGHERRVAEWQGQDERADLDT